MEQFESFSVPDGPTISVWPAPERLGPGSMMRWVMDQPGDGREGQVYLPPESADILAGLLLSPELRRPDPGDAICGEHVYVNQKTGAVVGVSRPSPMSRDERDAALQLVIERRRRGE